MSTVRNEPSSPSPFAPRVGKYTPMSFFGGKVEKKRKTARNYERGKVKQT
jgi:hypothetical protein